MTSNAISDPDAPVIERPKLSTIVPMAMIIVAILAMIGGFGPIGAALLAVGVVLLGFVRPDMTMVGILALFLVQPLVVRILERDFGLTGIPLVVASAWKELALASVLATVALPEAARWLRAGRRPTDIPLLDVLVAALIVLVLIALLVSPSVLALNQARLILFPIGVYVALRFAVLSADTVMNTILVAGTVIGAFGIVQSTIFGFGWVTHYFGTTAVPIPATFTATFVDAPRASGTLGSPNEFAFVIGVCVVIAIAILLSRSHAWVIASAASLFVLLPALALSSSRSSLLGAIAGIGVSLALGLYVTPVRRQAVRQLATTLLPAVLLASVVFISRGGIDIVTGTVATIGSQPGASQGPTGASPKPGPTGSGQSAEPEPQTDPSTLGHLASLGEGIRMLSSNPFGIGLGNVGAHVPPGGHDPVIIVESWYISMGLALGLPGLVLSVLVLAAMVVLGIRAALSGRGRWPGVALAGTATLASIVSVVLPSMLEPQLAMLAWALAAAVLLSRSRLGQPSTDRR